MFLRLMGVAVYISGSFLFIAPLYGVTTVYLPILLLIDIQVVFRFWLLCTFVYESLCQHTFSFLLGNTMSGMEWLDPTVVKARLTL